MGKQGPCYHCGVTSTPLWRNGPPEKPVLCNACGSRWRTKGTLVNYTPLHSRAEPDELEDHRFSRMKNINIPIKNKDTKILKRKQIYDNPGPFFEYNHVPSKLFDEDTSNRSSSGSAVSNSESCAQFNSTDASDLTGPSQGNAWDTSVPSRKRTCVSRSKASSVEKLTKDLYTILHEQQSSYLSGSSEEELLFDSDKPMVSVEIGHGSVLIRHPSSIARDEESEASSLSVDNKRVRTNLTTMPHVNMLNKGVKVANIGTEIMKKPSGLSLDHEQIKKDKDHLEKLHILGHHTSPLCKVDLKEFLNFDTFVTHLTIEEQQSLLKYLPSTDNFAPPDSLKNMFESTQFSENIYSFQNLLSEGVFDNTLSGAKLEDCKTLKRFILCNLNKSKWVEKCTLLKDEKSKMTSGVANPIIPTGYSVNVKKPRDGQFANIAGAKTFIKSPKRMIKTEQKEPIDNDGSFFSPKSLFALPPDNSSLYAESSDHDLLLDIPSNSFFPQAELLNVPSSSYGGQGSNSSSSGSGSGSGSGSVYPPHLVRR